MDKFINISLTRPDKMRTGTTKEIYRNSVQYDNAVTFPFSEIVRALKVLYPYPDLIINFQILP